MFLDKSLLLLGNPKSAKNISLIQSRPGLLFQLFVYLIH